MKEQYSAKEFDNILSRIQKRLGWDFSSMKTKSSPKWDYLKIVKEHLNKKSTVLDIGTGGGEKFSLLAEYFSTGLGVDIDPGMIEVTNRKSNKPDNISFRVSDIDLKAIDDTFDVILDRHAPFNLVAIKEHLRNGGIFITQQVGELNMLNIKKVLGQTYDTPPVTKAMFSEAGLGLIDFMEYDIEYIVEDIGSLVFWLRALDIAHSDMESSKLDVGMLNRILKNNVSSKGFVTNEHRYLVVAKK